jgi:hypothetical protein
VLAVAFFGVAVACSRLAVALALYHSLLWLHFVLSQYKLDLGFLDSLHVLQGSLWAEFGKACSSLNSLCLALFRCFVSVF